MLETRNVKKNDSSKSGKKIFEIENIA